jgi:hypothetical protein
MLFMSGDHSGADKVFYESIRREFAYNEAIAIHFRPSTKGVPLQMRGKVAAVKPNYAFVQVEGYPKFISPKSKHGPVILKVGDEVEFAIEFSARGPVAVWPKVLGQLQL